MPTVDDSAELRQPARVTPNQDTSRTRPVRSGLDRLLAEPELRRRFQGRRIGLLANQASVTRHLEHAIDAMQKVGIELVRLFGPEHGLRGFAQDMETVRESVDSVSGLPVTSLYGSDFDSLRPPQETLADVDCILIDVPDIGTRYYTFAASALYLAEAAVTEDVEVWVLDRPNPINGVAVEGNLIEPGFDSFVGAISVPNRHGLTLAELLDYARRFDGKRFDFEVVEAAAWSRNQWFDETELPWVMPSPNMPSLHTAIIYPGLCLLEATNLSEGRGTTRPFELFGAPYVDGAVLTAELNRLELPGVAFRSAVFKPGFQKHAGNACFGCQLHILNRDECRPYRVGLAIVWLVRRLFPAGFRWRRQPYEFVDDIPAIDLLCGTARVREAIERDASLEAVVAAATSGAEAYRSRFNEVLRYRDSEAGP